MLGLVACLDFWLLHTERRGKALLALGLWANIIALMAMLALFGTRQY